MDRAKEVHRARNITANRTHRWVRDVSEEVYQAIEDRGGDARDMDIDVKVALLRAEAALDWAHEILTDHG